MDQVKIGGFIATLRKEQGLTQKQLAEQIGVSDKTISKWECGNGLPELSSIPALCSTLGINMNELLSGERLAEETYSKKAEENMMTLMKENVEQKKKNRNSLVTLILSLVAVGLILVLANIYELATGKFSLWSFLDFPTLLMILIPTVVVVVAAGLGKAFFRAFIILGDRSKYTVAQRRESKLAVKLVAKAVIIIGILVSIIPLIYLGAFYYQSGIALEQLIANAAIAMYGVLYGSMAYLLLLPIQSKLEAEPEN